MHRNKGRPAGTRFFFFNWNMQLKSYSLSLALLLETPEAGLVLPFIAAGGVVCGRNCGALVPLHENRVAARCVGTVQSSRLQNLHRSR